MFKIFFILLSMCFFSYSIANDNQLKVGVVGFDLKPEIGIPLAGYGDPKRRLPFIDIRNKYPHSFFFKPTEGERDPIRSKVMAFTKGEDKLIFISVDMVGVDQRMVYKLSRRLKEYGVKIEQIFLTGTHTHSGPGTLSRNIALSAIASDVYKKRNYYVILNRMVESVVQALQIAEPVKLYSSSFETHGIQKNKFRHIGLEHFDKTANFLLAKSIKSNKWLGGMVNYAMHGNAMPVEDMRYSADILGAIERNLESALYSQNKKSGEKPTILFMNGAEGDVKHQGGRGEAPMEQRALEFAQQAQLFALNLKNMKQVEPNFSYSRQRVKIGWPYFPVMCKNKDKKSLFSSWKRIKRSPFKFKIPLYPIFPRRGYLSIAKVGDIVMMTWPGEASTTLGLKLKEIARSKGYNNPWVLGLTNDYLTYFTTKEEYLERHYDSCSSMYGYRGGERILKYYDWALDNKI